jgi:hypothetical protein
MTRKRAAAFWLSLVVVVVGFKLAMLGVDAVPRIFSGDSGFYLHTALTGGIPNDRSFTYGRIIRLVTGERHTIQGLITLQVLASAAAALLLGVGLRVGFAAPYGVVALGTLLVTVEPLQLAYERFIMTESLAGLCYALILVGGLVYLRHPRTTTLVCTTLAGVALFSLRLSTVAVGWVVPLALPLLAWRTLSAGSRLRPWLHLAVALSAVIASHTVYREAYGLLQRGPVAYYYAGGRFMLGFVSPLVRPEDFPDGLAARILPEVKAPLALRSDGAFPLTVRDSHMWRPDGLTATIQRLSADVPTADALDRAIAMRVIRRDPAGVVKLGVLTLRSYFDPTLAGLYDPDAFATLIDLELGPPELPDDPPLRAYGIGPASLGPSPLRDWHVAAIDYYPFLLACPLIALAAVPLVDRRRRGAAVFAVLVSVLMVATAPLLASSATIRYLHPLGWMNVFAWILLGQAVVARSVPERLPRPDDRGGHELSRE